MKVFWNTSSWSISLLMLNFPVKVFIFFSETHAFPMRFGYEIFDNDDFASIHYEFKNKIKEEWQIIFLNEILVKWIATRLVMKECFCFLSWRTKAQVSPVFPPRFTQPRKYRETHLDVSIYVYRVNPYGFLALRLPYGPFMILFQSKGSTFIFPKLSSLYLSGHKFK